LKFTNSIANYSSLELVYPVTNNYCKARAANQVSENLCWS